MSLKMMIRIQNTNATMPLVVPMYDGRPGRNCERMIPRPERAIRAATM